MQERHDDPKLEKIVINMGVGEAVNDRKKVTTPPRDLALIAGQKPVITKPARRSRPTRCAKAWRSAPR
jgi:large subunit ribosomal protein L5